MRTLIIFSLLLLSTAAFASPGCNTPLLPKPGIGYNGQTNGTPGYINVWFVVGNHASYDNALFAASPNLPACGLNTKASRTWLEIYTDTGVRIYGYCALTQSSQIAKLSWPWKASTPKPKGFYIKLVDRLCNRTVQSNTIYNF